MGAQKCNALVDVETVLASAGPQSTPFHEDQYRVQYRVQNGNMRNFGPTNLHSTAFAPKQWSYQTEATCMESSKMKCSNRCRNRTYQYGAANYPASWGAVQGQEWKYAKLRAYRSPWYRVCTKAMVTLKGSYVYGELKNVML